MGTVKALLQLGGKPLIEHAVTKLRRICADVHILSSNSELAPYAPLVRDIHPNCGPLGGIEAALLHSPYDWNLFLAVDMPFYPRPTSTSGQ
jgi:molybdopterin-guanine dinucleotide biosynthesis protein A